MSRGDTPGEGPRWHVYITEWCGCILIVSRICRVGSPLHSLWFSSSWVSYSYGRSSLTAETFLWPHCQQPPCKWQLSTT